MVGTFGKCTVDQMPTKTIKNASVLWDYMSSFGEVACSDALVVCCSYELRVCDYACELIGLNLADKLVLTGKTGNWTRHMWDRPEAHVFYERATQNGVPEDRILVESRATNLGENVRFSRKLLETAKTVMFLTKPATVLRLKLTIEAQWPDVVAYVSCPTIKFPEGVSNTVGIIGAINEMVGDVHRIRRYSELGYQSPHELPAHVMEAWTYLVGQGFTHHLVGVDSGKGRS